MVVQPSPGASMVPLSIEPVIGWRLWCIGRDGDGGLVLVSPMRDHTWAPREPSKATCHAHGPQDVPRVTCGCGFYAVSRLDRLPRAFGVLSEQGIGVVGSVAMWGRVIEHAVGYRGQQAYPDRIRLVCRRCFLSGRDGVPTRIDLDAFGRILPACQMHAEPNGSEGEGFTPDEVQQLLLSAYAIDPLPVQTLHEAGFAPGHPGPARLVAAARAEARELGRTPAGWLTIALLVLAFLVARSLNPSVAHRAPDVATPPDPSVAAGVGPFADDLAVGPPFDLVHTRPGRRPVAPRSGVVCGHRIGIRVQVMGCGRARAELFGFYDSPPGPKGECFGSAYSRRQHLSVCWIDFFAELGQPVVLLRLPDVHRWDLV